MAVITKRPTTFRQYRTLLKKDLRQEFHTGNMLVSMIIFAVLLLIIYGVAVSQAPQTFDIIQISGGLIWALIILTSLLGLNRSFSAEKEQDALAEILLAPIDRSVIFLAKATSNLLFLLIVEAVSVVLFVFFFLTQTELSEQFWWMIVPLVVGTVGIAGIGTLLATITINTRGRDIMLAVLLIPLSFPLLYACVSATTAAFVGGDAFFDTFMIGVVMAAVYDIIMILLSWVLYEFVVSA